jgi:hypothetical protein
MSGKKANKIGEKRRKSPDLTRWGSLVQSQSPVPFQTNHLAKNQWESGSLPEFRFFPHQPTPTHLNPKYPIQRCDFSVTELCVTKFPLGGNAKLSAVPACSSSAGETQDEILAGGEIYPGRSGAPKKKCSVEVTSETLVSRGAEGGTPKLPQLIRLSALGKRSSQQCKRSVIMGKAHRAGLWMISNQDYFAQFACPNLIGRTNA